MSGYSYRVDKSLRGFIDVETRLPGLYSFMRCGEGRRVSPLGVSNAMSAVHRVK